MMDRHIFFALPALLFAAGTSLAPVPGHAQTSVQNSGQNSGQTITPASTPKEERARLRQVQQELNQVRARTQALQGQAKSLEESIAVATQSMIALAQDIQQREERVSRLSQQLKTLEMQRAALALKLASRQQESVRLLGALQTLSRRPPQLLVIQPEGALKTARASALMAVLLPKLQAQSQALQKDLTAMASLKATLDAERLSLANELKALEDDRARLEGLRLAREARRKEVLDEAQDEAARAKELAEQAADIQDLIAKLEVEARRRTQLARLPGPRLRPDLSRAEPARPAAPAPPATTASRPQRPTVATNIPRAPNPGASNPSTPNPGTSRPPANFNGILNTPTAGQVVLNFGQNDGTGPSKGIRVQARAEAQVVAPYPGRVVFAGPFRSFGNTLIIAHGETYHTVIAGMARVDARVGQIVQAGEPIGMMGTAEGASAETGTASAAPPAAPVPLQLYIEVRRSGTPVNPVPWLLSGPARARG
jgi:septal ring factor EnvC (AmiA/AmiB activator)